MARIFSLWAQCSTQEEARSFADHFARLSITKDDGTTVRAETSVEAGTCCWVRPTNVSRSGVTDQHTAAQLTLVGHALYDHLKSAPAFWFALAGVEVDDVRSEDEVVQITGDPHPAFPGLVVAYDIWERAERPSGFVPFRSGSVWRPYEGEAAAGGR